MTFAAQHLGQGRNDEGDANTDPDSLCPFSVPLGYHGVLADQLLAVCPG